MAEKYPVYVYKIDKVNILYGKVFSAWCEKNCKGLWRVIYYELGGQDVQVVVSIIEKDDAMKFKLRWM